MAASRLVAVGCILVCFRTIDGACTQNAPATDTVASERQKILGTWQSVTVKWRAFYQVFVGPGALFEQGQRISPRNVADGTVNTLAIITAPEAVPWTKPADLAYSPAKRLPPLGVGMINDGLISFATADSSVWITRNTQDEKLLRALITRSGFEFIDMKDLAK